MLKVQDVAEHLQVSPGTIYAAIAEGKLKAYRFGNRGRGTLRISEESLREYLAGSTVTVELSPDQPVQTRITLPRRRRPGRRLA